MESRSPDDDMTSSILHTDLITYTVYKSTPLMHKVDKDPNDANEVLITTVVLKNDIENINNENDQNMNTVWRFPQDVEVSNITKLNTIALKVCAPKS